MGITQLGGPDTEPPHLDTTGSVRAVGFIELADVSYALPGGWTLFEGVSFRVPEGEHAALVGANGIGKTTLLRLLAGEDRPTSGSVRTDGRVGLMRQFIGSSERSPSRRRSASSCSPTATHPSGPRPTGSAVPRSGSARCNSPSDVNARAGPARVRGGPPAWETGGRVRGRGVLGPLRPPRVRRRLSPRARTADRDPVGRRAKTPGPRSRSSRRPSTCSCSTSPTTRSTSRARPGSRTRSERNGRTILFVSHDRTVLERAATRIVTLEGRATWTHAGPFSTYAAARDARVERLDERHRRFEEEREAPRRLHEGDEAESRVQRRLRLDGSQRREATRALRRARACRRRRPPCRTCGCASTAAGRAKWRSVPADSRSRGSSSRSTPRSSSGSGSG